MSFLELKQPFSGHKLGKCVAAIYHHSQGSTLDQFKNYCYNEINKVILLGECFWQIKLDESLHFIDPTITENNFSSNTDQTIKIQNNNQVTERFTQTYSTYSQTEVIQFFHNKNCGISHHFYFSPNNNKCAFSNKDLEHLNLIIAHLMEAFRLNFLSLYQRQWANQFYASAIFDSSGIFKQVDDDFLKIVIDIKPDWNGAVFPFSLPRSSQFIQKNKTVFKVDKVLDMYFLRAFHLDDIFGHLTLKEKEVCFYLKKALSNKEIAQITQISRKTIENHLAAIYLKTGINSRAKLVSVLNQS